MRANIPGPGTILLDCPSEKLLFENTNGFSENQGVESFVDFLLQDLQPKKILRQKDATPIKETQQLGINDYTLQYQTNNNQNSYKALLPKIRRTQNSVAIEQTGSKERNRFLDGPISFQINEEEVENKVGAKRTSQKIKFKQFNKWLPETLKKDQGSKVIPSIYQSNSKPIFESKYLYTEQYKNYYSKERLDQRTGSSLLNRDLSPVQPLPVQPYVQNLEVNHEEFPELRLKQENPQKVKRMMKQNFSLVRKEIDRKKKLTRVLDACARIQKSTGERNSLVPMDSLENESYQNARLLRANKLIEAKLKDENTQSASSACYSPEVGTIQILDASDPYQDYPKPVKAINPRNKIGLKTTQSRYKHQEVTPQRNNLQSIHLQTKKSDQNNPLQNQTVKATRIIKQRGSVNAGKESLLKRFSSLSKTDL